MGIFLKVLGQQLLQVLIPNLLGRAEVAITKITQKVAKVDPASFKGVIEGAAAEIVTSMFYTFSQHIKQDMADGTVTKAEATESLKAVGTIAEAQLTAVVQKLPDQIIPIVLKDVPLTIQQTYELLKRRGELASQNQFFAKALAAQAK